MLNARRKRDDLSSCSSTESPDSKRAMKETNSQDEEDDMAFEQRNYETTNINTRKHTINIKRQ